VVGSVSDPSGDAGTFGGTAGGPDLVSATVLNTGTALVFQVRFAPASFNSETSTAQLVLDTDGNAATGHQGVDSSCGPDAGVIGSEFILDASGGGGTLFQYQGTCNLFVFLAEAAVEVVADGYNITVPLAVIGDDGLLNYKVISYVPGSGVLDVMPNVGLPAGHTGGQ
jgi:hypothetical protein